MLGLFDEALEYLPGYRVLVCKKCRFAIQPSAVSNHLKRHQLYRDRRKCLLDAINTLELVEPQDVTVPPPDSQPIPALPVYNGYSCLIPGCGYNCASLKRIQSHESAGHGHPANMDVNCKQVCLQTFFQGTQIKYFQVAAPGETDYGYGGPTPVRRTRIARDSSTPESPMASTPPNSVSSALALEDLRLMHHFTLETAVTLHRGIEPDDFWYRQIPLLASSCRYLMRGVLSLAAAHLAYLQPCNSLEWMEVATRHHTEGLSLFRSAISVPKNADTNAAITFSRLLMIYKCADYQNRMRAVEDDTEFSRDALTEYLSLTRGGCHLATTSSANMQAQASASFVAFLPHRRSLSLSGPPEVRLPFDIDMRLREMGNSITPLLTSADTANPEDFEAIHSAISALKSAFSRLTRSTERDPLGGWDAVDYWPAAISDRYCAMIKEQHPIALIVFAHFCILLHRNSQHHWFMASHARFLLETISSLLEDETYSRLISWPRRQIGI